MNNKKTITYLIIFVAFMIVIIGGATFAFFASTQDINANLPANITTASKTYTFIASADGEINFHLSATDMSEDNVNENYIMADNGLINVEVASATDNETTTCTYDIQWVWDSENKYTESDVTLPYTEGGKTYPYELSVTVDGKNETDLSKLTWTDGKAIVASGLEIKSTSKTPVKITHNIEVKSYNIPVDQQNLFNKDFRAHLEVVNNSCSTKVSNVTLNYYVKDLLASNYTKVDEVPKGNYDLVTSESSCTNGGTIGSYDETTGALDMTVGDTDTCNIYFEEYDPKLIKAADFNFDINHLSFNVTPPKGVTNFDGYLHTASGTPTNFNDLGTSKLSLNTNPEGNLDVVMQNELMKTICQSGETWYVNFTGNDGLYSEDYNVSNYCPDSTITITPISTPGPDNPWTFAVNFPIYNNPVNAPTVSWVKSDGTVHEYSIGIDYEFTSSTWTQELGGIQILKLYKATIAKMCTNYTPGNTRSIKVAGVTSDSELLEIMQFCS